MLFVISCLRVPVQQFQEFFFVVGISALIGVSVEAVLPHDGLLLRGHQTAQLHHACELEKTFNTTSILERRSRTI